MKNASSSTPILVTRAAQLPDPTRLARCSRAPELGPRILFFSGGSAIKVLSQKLVAYTHQSVHLITPFDSGGSSATLRAAFGMLSVGDLRNRLIALSDPRAGGHSAIRKLFAHRLDPTQPHSTLVECLSAMLTGRHELVAAVPPPMREIIRIHLRSFWERMPADFDLRGASIGNLILAGGYLHHDNDIEAVVFLFSKLVEVRGLVRPIVSCDLHLAATLEDHTTVVGQHRMTGKEVPPLASRVVNLELVRGLDDPSPVTAAIDPSVAALIQTADLICFPVGSFYSSIIANLLPSGVGRAIAAATCPKVFVPNPGHDPELVGATIVDCVQTLLNVLRRDAGPETPVSALLQYVLVDDGTARYEHDVPEAEALEALGVQCISTDLSWPENPARLDGEKLAQTLISLC